MAGLEQLGDRSGAAELLRSWGDTFQTRAAWDAAVERLQKALALDQESPDRKPAAGSLSAARTLAALGTTQTRMGDFAAAETSLQRALAIREALAPDTAEVAKSFNLVGILARRRGDLTAAEGYLARAEELLRRLAPGSFEHGRVLNSLGNLAHNRGDLERAESMFRQAAAIYEQTVPTGAHVIACLSNLASVVMDRGDLAAADDLLHRVLVLREGTEDGELGRSTTLVLLGNLAVERGDLETADADFRQALTIAQKLAPEGQEAADSLGSLGSLANVRGDLATARTYLRRALAIEEKLAPEGLNVAIGLENLAQVEHNVRGDHGAADAHLRRALAIFEKLAPRSLPASIVLRDLGEGAAAHGRLREAIALHRRALEIQRQLVSGSSDEAETLYFLGRAERRAGRSREGIRDLCGAVDVYERERVRVGGAPEARTSFEAAVDGYYHACLEGLIDRGRPAAAFHILERGRARVFLALLAERDLRLSGLPPELAAERKRINAEYDRVQSQLAAQSAQGDDAEVERLTGALRDLRSRQEEILARIRRESPRAAALQDPEPLDLAGVRAGLDPGTVLLEYAVGEATTWLFVVQSPSAKGSGLSIFRIARGDQSLRREVESYRLLLKNPGSTPAEVKARGRRLYDLLVRPAESRIAKAQRILVSPHGPLDTLPFAVLVRQGRYLVEWKPIHSVLSGTVYAELARSRPRGRLPGGERLIAFGAPSYPSASHTAAADPVVREAIRQGLVLARLPFSSQEVGDIAALYPEAQVYLGPEATEERAKSIPPGTSIVHFSCHGVLDERFPLNSALALTVPEHPAEGQDNGLLQAWEIFESVRLDADLVTLSACDSGLGREMAGEGLIGLTRAFQYAGARSVLASLWGVADRSTARFMKSFYGHLRAGKPKDEALRAAQVDQIRAKSGLSHPFHWAAFVLSGDWQ